MSTMSADSLLFIEAVALGAHEAQEGAGLGRESEDSHPARCQQQELMAQARTPAVQPPSSNSWVCKSRLHHVFVDDARMWFAERIPRVDERGSYYCGPTVLNWRKDFDQIVLLAPS